MLRRWIIAMGRSAIFRRCLAKNDLYSHFRDRSQIEAYQVDRFNDIWREASTNVPIYADMRKQFGLPDRITSLEDLNDWPVITRRELRDAGELLTRQDCSPDTMSMTGGTTGEPMRFGKFHCQDTEALANAWVGRSRYGVRPDMKYFLLWGHSHGLGKGLGRLSKLLLRKVKDAVLGCTRCNAYDLSPARLRKYFKTLAHRRAKVFIGYSAATLAFCRANRDQEAQCHRLHLQCAICSAGPLSMDERREISEFFNAPVCMEYGSVECGVMAYTRPDTDLYGVFWDTHLLQPLDHRNDGTARVIVTGLSPSYLPLIRYDLGDLVQLDGEATQSILNFDSIVGRPDYAITFANGVVLHSSLLRHTIRKCRKVLAGQAVVSPSKIVLRVIVGQELSQQEKDSMGQRIFTQLPRLKGITIEVQEVSQLDKTPAGKVRLLIRQDQ